MFFRPRIIPVLTIDDRDLVKTKQFDHSVYLGDPVNAVKIFNLKGIDEMAVLDISATRRATEPDYELLGDIASQAFMPLSYGGGIQSLEQARKILALGYEKITVNTALIRDEALIRELSAFAGTQSVVASIDAKISRGQYVCVTGDGREETDIRPAELAKKAETLGCGEIFLNSVDRDGMMNGYDVDLIRQVTDAVDIPVTACGGAGSVGDLKSALQTGRAHAAAAGSLFVFYGKLHAVLITFPAERELTEAGIYGRG